MNYANQHVRFERRGDRVQPVRVRKEWISLPSGKRLYVTTRITEIGFARPEAAPEPWESCPPSPITRDSLRAQGLIRELGYGMEFLPVGNPSEWSYAIANEPSPWDEAYGNRTE